MKYPSEQGTCCCSKITTNYKTGKLISDLRFPAIKKWQAENERAVNVTLRASELFNGSLLAINGQEHAFDAFLC